jgi:hypothetical protein
MGGAIFQGLRMDYNVDYLSCTGQETFRFYFIDFVLFVRSFIHAIVMTIDKQDILTP